MIRAIDNFFLGKVVRIGEDWIEMIKRKRAFHRCEKRGGK